ncbi:AbgT family transporter [Streptomyces flaveus]|nr:AbgT family transporter [Streptomyces flaveus]
MTATDVRDTYTKGRMNSLLRVIGAIERAGNKLPHPF